MEHDVTEILPAEVAVQPIPAQQEHEHVAPSIYPKLTMITNTTNVHSTTKRIVTVEMKQE